MLSLATDSATGNASVDTLEASLGEVARSSFISETRVQKAIVEGWERAVEHFLDDGELDESEEQHLADFRAHFSLTQEQLDVRDAYSRLVKGAVLRDVLQGRVPERCHVEGGLPFNFQKTEKLIWLFLETEYYEDRDRRQYVGGHHGVSFRIVKGIYYRVGAFKGEPIETRERNFIGTGPLAITNRHLYFNSPDKSFRIRHDKIVTIEPYSDGVSIHRDAQTAKPQTFVTGDGWFTYNLLMNVSSL